MDVAAQQYAQRCSELYAAGGFAAVRRTAQAGLDQVGPTAVLYRWLGQAHAAEDEDDHDAEAERAYRSGLALAPDDLGLLVCYLELCLRADAFDYPARAGRVATLRARIDELAPAGSPERQRVDDALGWAGRGYWDDLVAAAGRVELRQAESAELSERVAGALRAGTPDAGSPATAGEDLREAELAAALELLRGRANAPLRYLLTHRTAVYVITCVAALGVNRLLVTTGVVTFSAWGWLLWIPLFAAEGKLRAARKLARERVVARIEERHVLETAVAANTDDRSEVKPRTGGTPDGNGHH
ncbi:hypothetical protein [Streptomyces sp. RO-S4]|uniref:hypothetical protein n=1 Tax=Streptomyces sp. RO-S4 TaxID=2902486 RepID=UPI00208ED34E|nr:hypothetical protein [Streptomyces sp. RO-S4]